MKLAAIQWPLGSFGRLLLALGVTIIFAFALESGITLGMEHGRVGGGAATPTDWLTYHNAATGLSFRYPRSLHIRERDPRSFGLPDAEEIMELVGETKLDPETVVLRFIVNRGERTPEEAAAKARAERERYANDTDSRASLTTMQVDGHEALIEVFCGARGPACHWKVNILQPRECVILTLIHEPIEDSLPPPHDDSFPLLSIIRTVHFDTAPK